VENLIKGNIFIKNLAKAISSSAPDDFRHEQTEDWDASKIRFGDVGEKILIAPDLRAGQQWLNTLTLHNCPVVNIRVKTLKHLVMDLSRAELSQKQHLSGYKADFFIANIWNKISDKMKYFDKAKPTLSLYQTIFRTIMDIRLADLTPDYIRESNNSSNRKLEDISVILDEYSVTLKESVFFDYADAIKIVLNKDKINIPQKIFMPEDLKVSYLEDKLHKNLSIIKIKVDPIGLSNTYIGQAKSGGSPDDFEFAQDSRLDLLRWLPNPTTAPAKRIEDDTVEIFAGVGSANEVREVLRRCLNKGYKLDEVEIIHTDYETYVPLIYETAMSMQRENEPLKQGMPIKFCEGIPVRYSKPGRALLGWVDWIEKDFRQDILVKMIRDNLLDIPEKKKHQELAAALQKIKIGFGWNRYIGMIKMNIKSHLDKQSNYDDNELDDDDNISAVKVHLEPYDIKRLDASIDFIENLLNISHKDEKNPEKILESALEFIEKYAHSSDMLDGYARQKIREDIKKIQSFVKEFGISASINIWDLLKDLPDSARVLASGPQPGGIYVSNIKSGGHSGRKYTFIIGLDESRFPGSSYQDPLLLDKERRNLSSNRLENSIDELEFKKVNFFRLLARLKGFVTFSYPNWNLKEDREIFPCVLLLDIFRIITGNYAADLDDFKKWLASNGRLPASFAPDSPNKCLSESEVWLWALCKEQDVKSAKDLVANRFCFLKDGMNLREKRNSTDFTEFDGYIGRLDKKFDPINSVDIVLSASSLETAGACPLKYFFRKILNVNRVETLELVPDEWLNKIEFGNLMHIIFKEFMQSLKDNKDFPVVYAKHKPLLDKIVNDKIKIKKGEIPPPTENSVKRQFREIQRVANIFLRQEEETSKTRTPYIFELGVEKEDKVELKLDDDNSIYISGKIDRVDKTKNGYLLLDYKTGLSNRYKEKGLFNQGRILQHFIYIKIAESYLKDLKTLGFEYLFLSDKEQGKRLSYQKEELEEQGKEIISKLCQIISNGCFINTNQEDDCKYCEYPLICGDSDYISELSNNKLVNTDSNENLKKFCELRKDNKNGKK